MPIQKINGNQDWTDADGKTRHAYIRFDSADGRIVIDGEFTIAELR